MRAAGWQYAPPGRHLPALEPVVPPWAKKALTRSTVTVGTSVGVAGACMPGRIKWKLHRQALDKCHEFVTTNSRVDREDTMVLRGRGSVV